MAGGLASELGNVQAFLLDRVEQDREEGVAAGAVEPFDDEQAAPEGCSREGPGGKSRSWNRNPMLSLLVRGVRASCRSMVGAGGRWASRRSSRGCRDDCVAVVTFPGGSVPVRVVSFGMETSCHEVWWDRVRLRRRRGPRGASLRRTTVFGVCRVGWG